ncbi:TPA: autotransporter domain-containing protein [Escherichia coli]|uniref:BigA/YdbA N-terminal beta-barrel domain-containing protein n=1 Tax=Escherichia coli TaxID=562 RepID=UPI00197AEE94|nr:autotransporter domain-containing protein [Escherichia coli]HBD5443376.1 autotransporter domain-containing protein [Escherichia coli]HCQ3817767.1 autotransporter domain-containing protein [Escherichia coli]HEB2128404.1 autotransporter domain-containing protein [Escherichia coli]HEK7292893.1 autotransporter domain-containing protein [Escherichia coli]
MQRKKLLSVCVAMALSSQTWAADTSIPDSTEKTRKSSKITCPANIHSLSKEQLENLSAECRENKDSAVLPWAAAGLAAVATGIAIYTLSDDDNHHHNNSPVPDDGGDTPVPPDDGGDTPVPPDDGGDTPVPPDDGGDTPVPPDDGGDTPVPPDDGGDTPVPPDDGGDTPVPPDDGGDTPVPPDDGGDTPVPPDDGGDTPVPPDDGGDTPVPDDGGDTPVPPDDGGDTPVKHDPVVYKNDVTWDQDAKTVKIRETTFTYSQNADGSYTLTAPDGKETIVKSWAVHDDSNTVVFDGVNTAGGITWSYDDDGLIHITKEAGVVVDGTTGTAIDFGNAIITDQGGNTALNGGTVMTVDGDNITLNNDGKTTAIGEGSVVGILTGDDITINNNGETEVDGGTAVIINGDNATLNTVGDSTISNGGTGSLINGDNARVDNKGTMSVDGENSTGSKIVGDGATIKQEGDLYVSGGAHGIDVDGNDTFVSNKGNITVIEDNSIGMLLDGDGVSVINMGDLNVGQAAAGVNAIGIQIDGDNATFVNVGDISATNAGTGVSVAGDKANISLAGGLDVGDFSTGLDVSGNNNNMTLATYELNVTGQKATGVNVSGDGNTIEIAGSILVDKDQKADNAQPYFFNPSTGVNISGNNNDVTLDGQLTVVADSETTVRSYASYDGAQEHIAGIVIAGDDNTFTLNGGVHFVGEKNVMDDGSKPSASRRGIGDTPLISVDGHSSVYLNGESTISGEFPLGFENLIQLSHGAELEIGADATFDMSDVDSFTYYYRVALSTISIDSGAKATNNGEVELKNIGFAAAWNKDSTVINNGSIGLAMYDFGTDPAPKVFDVEYGGIGVNNGTMTTKMMNQHSVLNYPAEWNLSDGTSFNNKALGLTGMLASYSSSILNGETGIIDMYGRGSVGMLAIDKSTADNEGQITLDTLWVDENDETSLRNNVANSTAKDFGVGMASGTDAYNGALTKATATNHENGVITVYNAGAGMAAYGNTNTVINQGTINLEKNENYNDSLGVNKLVGMAVYEKGTAINDQTGVININAENGQAFYNDGTGLIINYGTICTFGVCQGADEYNPTDNYIADLYDDGDVLSSAGETVSLSSGAIINGDVTSAGTVKNGKIQILENGALVNESSGTINSAIVVNAGGTLTNEGVLNTVTLEGGTFNNNGTLNDVVKIEKNSNAVINNTGSLSTLQLNDGTVNNSGIASARVNAQGDAVFNNLAGGEARKGAILYNSAVVNNAGTWKMGYQDENNNAGTLDIDDQSTFNNSGKLILDNSKNAIRFQGSNANATLYNTGEMTLDAALGAGAIHYDDGASQFINKGVVDAKVTVAVSTAGATESDAFLWNQDGGVINFDKDNASAVKFTHNNYVALNDGVMNISGNNAVAMEGDKNAQLVNNGVINIGTEGTTDTGLIGMQLDANATADAVIENNGTINIYANDSFAFSVLGTQGHIVNNGTVVIADGVTGSGLIKQGDSVNVEGVNGNNGNNTEVHYTDYTLPEVPNTSSGGVTTGGDATGSGSNNLNGYVVGTNVDGSAGKLKVNNASMNGVGINTGFAAGTADTTVSFDNVVEGSNLTDADAITSTSVVWTAKGSTDASGNVDVTMSKNAYTDVATDASVNDVAKALDAGYTNNELYTSLNVGTTAELNSALKQVSGSQATTVFREARVLSNRFSMLADAAPKMGNGLAFNVVAKGDPRAELGNNTEYDMLALRKTVDLSESQSLSLEYGIARLDGDGAQKAGDNGVTGGYSQFFGLKHQMFFDNGMNWNNALRYDVHNLDSSRSVAYGDVSKTADTDVKQQYLEFRSEGAKTFEPREGLKITPYAGVKLRHTLEGGYQERNAGDFNLSMNSGSETAVDSIVGLKLDYAGKGGWSANATLEGGPNLSYSKSQRTASLAGAGSQHFNVDDGQKGGGINSLASVGVKYSSKESSLNLDAYHWKEDGISDKGVMLNFKKTF